MIKAIIVEDEIPLQELIRIMVQEIDPDIYIAGVYASVEAALPAIQQLQPALIFLDVMLPGGTGFELLERLGDGSGSEVIFISAHDHFAIAAFRHAAVGYVMKPIDSRELQRAIAIARKRITQARPAGTQHLDELVRSLKQAATPANRIALPARTGYIITDAKDIIRCEGQGAYTSIFLHSGRKILCSRNLGAVKELLPDQSFVQIHRSHVVAVEAIIQFDYAASTVELSDGAVLPVAKNNKQLLLNYFRTL